VDATLYLYINKMECEQWLTVHEFIIALHKKPRCGIAGNRARPFTRLPGYLIGIIHRFEASWRHLEDCNAAKHDIQASMKTAPKSQRTGGIF